MIEVPVQHYLMLDGAGDPNTDPAFGEALEALYPLAYALKFASKHAGRDHVVPPLEGLWWADDMAVFTDRRDKSQWSWTLMLAVPDWLDRDDVEAARGRVRAKRAPTRIDDVDYRPLAEGRCLQTLHVGSFDDEAPVLAELHGAAADAGWVLTGRHHEVYLSDVRRAAPDRQRTILRQPVRDR